MPALRSQVQGTARPHCHQPPALAAAAAVTPAFAVTQAPISYARAHKMQHGGDACKHMDSCQTQMPSLAPAKLAVGGCTLQLVTREWPMLYAPARSASEHHQTQVAS